MSPSTVVLIGGPDTGKTNFIGRLWIALRAGKSALEIAATPDEIAYVEDVVEHLHQGHFAPRTAQNLQKKQSSLTIPLLVGTEQEKCDAELVIPDVSGEVWKNAVDTMELSADRMAQLESAVGALLFLRVLSPLNVDPLDWVNAGQLINYQGSNDESEKLPTQVMLSEFVRFLDLKLPKVAHGRKPRLGIIVTAWDLLDEEQSKLGPRVYIKKNYPLFSGRLADIKRFEISVFAMSIFGGDPATDEGFRDKILDSGLKGTGYVRHDNGETVTETEDISLPVAWAAGYETVL